MAVEIERKFLVTSETWRPLVKGVHHFRQGYIAQNERLSIRVRIDDRDVARLTIKSAGAGVERQELEYTIPCADAETLLAMRDGALISKTRHVVPIGRLHWEIDVFQDANAGLILAEVELERADQSLELPDWIGLEVTHDRRYYSAELARRPFASW